MTPDQFADEIRDFVVGSLDRATGVGAEQYSYGDTQKFETMALGELIAWTTEELQDVVNYAVMLHIRLRRIQTEVAGHFERRIAALEAEGT